VDDVNQNGQPKRRRVLRARDVMPPFDKSVPPVADGGAEAEQPQPVGGAVPTLNPQSMSQPLPLASDGGSGAETASIPTDAGETAAPLRADGVEIPRYDLAENILAEQRRAAGKRRRAPGRAEDEPVVPPRGTGVRTFVPEPASQDLLELQRIVAEIVARDIERLCKRPDRPPLVVGP
jgi:hypothetical protein